MKGKRLGFIMTLVLIMALAMPAWALHPFNVNLLFDVELKRYPLFAVSST